MRCAQCGESIAPGKRGPAATYCSGRCRVAAHRSRQPKTTDRRRRPRILPTELTDRAAWVRADGKRPIRCDGSAASSTNRGTWSTYEDVTASSAGDGFGIMLGDGLGCIDLDHCIDGRTVSREAAAAIAAITEPVVWVERSVSGTGLHVFIRAAEAPGWKRGGVERYTRQRFIRVTGDRFTL